MNLTDDQKIRRLPWALAHIATNAVFAQVIMGPLFVLFLTELGLAKAQIGLLLSLFPLTGIVALVVAPIVGRVGYKRTFVGLWGMRKLVAACLLLTPSVAAAYGPAGTLRFVAAVLAVFALCRATAETAMYPWMREFIPDRVRGRFVAMDSIVGTLFGFGAVILAGYMVAVTPGLTGFMRMIAIAVAFGLIAVVAASFIPGGAPIPVEQRTRLDPHALAGTLRDGRFVRFLMGLGLMSLAAVPLSAFLPLFAKERIGLSQANVILLQNASLAGGLLSGYLWGLAADRIGGRPVLLAGAAGAAVLPLVWLAVPAGQPWSFAIASTAAFLTGAIGPAWSIGSMRYLYIDVIPQANTERYTTVYYAWAGLSGGIGAILSGQILDSTQALAGPTLNGYTLLFAGGAVMALASLAVLSHSRSQPRSS